LTISNTLKYIFLIYFIACLIFGIIYFVSPEFIADATGWPWMDHAAGRVLGAMFLGYAIGALFCFRATEWSEVKIMVMANMVWCLLGAVGIGWMMAVWPEIQILAGWVYLILPALFFILFLYAYYTHK
jgi:hypothetical protein